MGICKYCGQDAGFLRHVHAACEAAHQEQVRKHDTAIVESRTIARRRRSRQRLLVLGDV